MKDASMSIFTREMRGEQGRTIVVVVWLLRQRLDRERVRPDFDGLADATLEAHVEQRSERQ